MENRVLLMGDVVKVGEIKSLASGSKVFEFTLRTWGKKPNGQTVFEYHPVTVWGDQLDRFLGVIKPGKMLRVDGQLSHFLWEDKYQKKRSRTIVRGLLIKELFLQIPPITEAERQKFDENQKNLFAGTSSGDSAESGS